ncbi:MAG: FAD-binding protein, partial [Oscillospiraceae bacterium]|nr:FAD-binding protein [Oscillospiraceae bacterium]
MDKIDILSGYCKESGCAFKLNENLAGYTSFKIGKTADIVVLPNTERQLTEVMRIVKECGLGYILLGNGSNVLLCEKNFGGAVIITSNMSDIKIEGESVYAGCGASLNKIAIAAKAHCLSGLEFAYGIPGSLGGAVHMNAGAYGGQMSDVVISSRCLDTDSLEIKDLSAAQHEFAYRESIYSKNKSLIAMSAVLNLKYGDQSKIESEMEKNMAARREK